MPESAMLALAGREFKVSLALGYLRVVVPIAVEPPRHPRHSGGIPCLQIEALFRTNCMPRILPDLA